MAVSRRGSKILRITEHEEKRSGSGVAIGCLLVLIFAPVMYVLSIGPFALLLEENPAVESIGVIYFPLGLLAEYCSPFATALEWYMELWTG